MSDFTVIGQVVIESDSAALDKLRAETGSAGSAVAGLGTASAGTDAELAGLAGSSTKAGEEAELAGSRHKGMGAAEEEAEGKTTSLAGGMGGLVGAIGGSIVALKAAEWFKSAGEAAATTDQNVALMSNAMEKNAGASASNVASTESWINAQARATGISHDELIPAMTKLVDTTHNVTESQGILTTAMNISAETHKPLLAVTLALAKASQGSVAGLARYGIATKDASGKTMTFTQVMAAANKVYGGDAQTAAGTTAGKIAKMSESYSQLKEGVGNDLLPVMSSLVGVLSKVMGVFDALPGPVKDAIVIVGGLIAVLGGAAVAANALGIGAAAVAVASGVASAASGVWTAAQWLLDAALDANPIALIVAAIAALVAGVILAYQHIGWFRDIVNDLWHAMDAAWQAIVSGVTTVWDWLVAAFKKYGTDIFIALTGPIGLLVLEIAKHWDTIKADATKAWDAVEGVVTAVWDFLKPYVMAAVGFIEDGIRTDVDVLKAIFTTGYAIIKTVVSDAWDAIKKVVSVAVAVVEGVIKTDVAIIKGVWAFWSDLVGDVSRAWDRISSAVTSGISDVVGFVKGLPGKIVSALGNLGTLLYNAGASLLSGLWNGISSAIGGLLSKIGGVASKVKDAVTGVLGIHSPSTEFHDIGLNIMQGWENGILAGAASLHSTLQAVAGGLSGAQIGGAGLTPAMAGGSAAGGPVGGPVTNYNLTIYSQAKTEQVEQDFNTLVAMNVRGT